MKKYNVIYKSVTGEEFITNYIIQAKNKEDAKKYLHKVTTAPDRIILEEIKTKLPLSVIKELNKTNVVYYSKFFKYCKAI